MPLAFVVVAMRRSRPWVSWCSFCLPAATLPVAASEGASGHLEAAIDVDDLSRNIGPVVGCEEDDPSRNLLRPAETPDQEPLHNLVGRELAYLGAHLGLDN